MADTPLGEVIERLRAAKPDGVLSSSTTAQAWWRLFGSDRTAILAALRAGQEYVEAALEVWEGQTPESEAWERYRTAQRALLAAYRKE